MLFNPASLILHQSFAPQALGRQTKTRSLKSDALAQIGK